jgi:hypothetical protein
MPNKIDWKGIPGLTIEVIKELTKLPGVIAEKAFESLSSREGSLAKITADQVRAFRDTDQGDASRLAIQSEAEGRVRPTREETFAGIPAQIPEGETFAGDRSGFVPIETQRGITPEVSGQQKRSSQYTRTTALKGTAGDILTEEGISNLDDADITERYTVFFGETPKDSSTARSEFLELLKSFSKTKSSLLD